MSGNEMIQRVGLFRKNSLAPLLILVISFDPDDQKWFFGFFFFGGGGLVMSEHIKGYQHLVGN